MPGKPPHCLPRPTAWLPPGNESVTTNAVASETKRRVFILASHDAFWFVLATRDYRDEPPSAMIANLARGRVVRLSLFFGAKVLRTALSPGCPRGRPGPNPEIPP